MSKYAWAYEHYTSLRGERQHEWTPSLPLMWMWCKGSHEGHEPERLLFTLYLNTQYDECSSKVYIRATRRKTSVSVSVSSTNIHTLLDSLENSNDWRYEVLITEGKHENEASLSLKQEQISANGKNQMVLHLVYFLTLTGVSSFINAPLMSVQAHDDHLMSEWWRSKHNVY